MDARLLKLIREYQRRVAEAVAMLAAIGIPRPSSNVQWASNDFEGRGPLPSGFTYRKHGFGCAVFGPDWGVDFDFGEAGQIDGFDPWRLFHFARKQLAEYGFESQQDITAAVELAVQVGDIVYSGNILYYVAKAIRGDDQRSAG
jgi:hypothetical protein